MTGHTKGPWYAGKLGDHARQIYVGNGKRRLFLVEAGNREEGVANASLIAAAPETAEERDRLLDILEAVLRHCVTPQGFPEKKHRTPEQQKAYEDARAALAKAEGRT